MNMRGKMAVCLIIQYMACALAFAGQVWIAQKSTASPAHAEVAPAFSVQVNEAPLPSTEPSTPEPSPASTENEWPVMQVEVVRVTPQPASSAGKRVLIYHTHTWEAYEQSPESPYRETEKWRTMDNTCNVVAVGAALAADLRALGLIVVHDTTAFEPPNLDDAYARSLAMLEQRTAAGEQYDLYIDLHRDAIASTSSIKKTVLIGGEEAARFMVLVGKGTTGGYADKPDWAANQDIARRITSSLNGQCDGLARDVKVKTGRFNQHIAPCCVLIECGMNTNTLEQVLCGVPYLAQAIADALTVQE